MKARVERNGMYCPCGAAEPMSPEEGRWLETRTLIDPWLSAERLLWYRCVDCGAITREILVPASF